MSKTADSMLGPEIRLIVGRPVGFYLQDNIVIRRRTITH